MRYLVVGFVAALLLVAGCSKKHKHGKKSSHDHSMNAKKAMGGDHMGHDHSGHDLMGHDQMGHDHSGHDHSGHDHGMRPVVGMAAMAGGMVTVSKAGQAYKPAGKKSQIPPGVWLCDMGTVHYARGEKGDGICPLCKMKLKQHAAK